MKKKKNKRKKKKCTKNRTLHYINGTFIQTVVAKFNELDDGTCDIVGHSYDSNADSFTLLYFKYD